MRDMCSSEALSDEYLHVNNCGIERVWEHDCLSLRTEGRIDCSLLYILQGCCYVNRDSQKWLAKSGTIIFFRPGERQCYSFLASEKSVSFFLHFTGRGCEDLLRQLGLWEHHLLNIGADKDIEALFKKMETEYTLKKPFYEHMLGGYLWQLLCMLARKPAQPVSDVVTKPSLDSVTLLMGREYMHNHPLSYYAQACSLSPSRFSHCFKEALGTSPIEYVLQIRIRNAKRLLLETSLSIAEIAESVGFSTLNYFEHQFKRLTGESPRQFAARNKEQAISGR